MTTKKTTTNKGKEHSVGSASAAVDHQSNALLRARQGHGFAAERANHMIDTVKGKRTRLVGDDFAKAGPDRTVNGVAIQSKYCASARASVDACFARNGKLIYQTRGRPMKIEVPKDQYPEALKLMAKKLQTGDVTAALARKQAKNILVEGNIDYDTARRIVASGNIDSLKFDAANGAVTAAIAGSVSVAVAYAQAVWNGEDAKDALGVACATGLKVGGVAWLSSVLTAQLGKSAVQSVVHESSGWMIKQLGSKATLTIANTLGAGRRLGTEVLQQSGRKVTGKAAETFLTKAVSSNVIAAAATTAVLSANDLCNVFTGHISKAQLFKNVTNTAAGVGGGMAGWAVGMAQGAAYLGWIPGGALVGGAVGAVIGSVVGGSAASTVSRHVTDLLIEDDAVEMMHHLERVFVEEAQDYLLTQTEAEQVMQKLQTKWDLREQMREMFASVSPEQYARWLIRPLVEEAIKRRKKIRMPTEKSLLKRAAEMLQGDLPGYLPPGNPRPMQRPLPSAPVNVKPVNTKAGIASAEWPFPTSSRP